jgi:hypothetical protein
MAVDTTQQQPYDPVAVLTRYLTQRDKLTAQEQKEKFTQGGTSPSVPSSTQHPLCNREISHHKREHQWHYEEIRAVRTIHQREPERL